MSLTAGDQRAVVSHYSIGWASMQLPVTTLPRPDIAQTMKLAS
jgi:hypothetical protein